MCVCRGRLIRYQVGLFHSVCVCVCVGGGGGGGESPGLLVGGIWFCGRVSFITARGRNRGIVYFFYL